MSDPAPSPDVLMRLMAQNPPRTHQEMRAQMAAFAVPHGFVQMEVFPQARECIDRMVAFLRRHV